MLAGNDALVERILHGSSNKEKVSFIELLAKCDPDVEAGVEVG